MTPYAEPTYFWWISPVKAGIRMTGPHMPLWPPADSAELRSALVIRTPYRPEYVPARAREVVIK